MAKKYALLIGTDSYEDDEFAPLVVPQSDIESLATVLSAPNIGGFDQVEKLLNAPIQTILNLIGDLFSEKSVDDLLLLYFSGHGALDNTGQLYLAIATTNYKRLSTSSLSSWLIKNEMNKSRSRRQILILDCCYAGAFSRNTAGSKSGIKELAVNQETFEVKGYGREILVSSSSTQRSWEGDKIIGTTDKSLFTHYMVEGLAGKAALNGQPEITVEQLYNYVYDKVIDANPNMTPQRWVEAQKDAIVIAHNPNPRPDTKKILPNELLIDLESSKPHIREGAVRELARLANSDNQITAVALNTLFSEKLRSERDIHVHAELKKVLVEIAPFIGGKTETALRNKPSNDVLPKKTKNKQRTYTITGVMLIFAALSSSVLKPPDFQALLGDITTPVNKGNTPLGQHILQHGKKRALLIANQHYRSLGNLATPFKDIDDLKQVLQRCYQFAEENITVVKDADRQQMIQALYNTHDYVGKQDSLLIYYAGHGYQDKSFGGKGFWIPSDARSPQSKETPRSTWVPNSQIHDIIEASQAKHVLLISDNCYSGTFKKKIPSNITVPNPDYYQLASLDSRRAITSGNLEPVLDGGGNGNSLFAHHLIDKLLDSNLHIFSAQYLFEQLSASVENAIPGFPQHPQYFVIDKKHDQGGDFIFVRKNMKTRGIIRLDSLKTDPKDPDPWANCQIAH